MRRTGPAKWITRTNTRGASLENVAIPSGVFVQGMHSLTHGCVRVMYYFRQPIFVKKIFSTLRVDNRPQASDSSRHKNSIDCVNFPALAPSYAY